MKPGLSIDFMELRRFEFPEERPALVLGLDSETVDSWGSISAAEKERLRDGGRKELGDNDGRCCVGEG